MTGADQPLSADSFRDPPIVMTNPIKSSWQSVRGGSLARCQKKRHLQGLRVAGIFVRRDRHERFLLLLDERKMSTNRADDCVSDVSIAVDDDQRFYQAVVAEYMSAAQSPFGARETLITNWTLPCVLLVVFLVKCHRMKNSHCSQTK